MKHALLALSALMGLTAVPALSHAQSSPLSFNAAVSSDYRYRGISQTRLKPAFSAGVDYAAANGFYVGAWGSTIKWIKDFGGDADVEIDVYGGYKGQFSKGLGYDVGLLQYIYPSAQTPTWDAGFEDPNTTELYGALTFGPVTGKVSYSLSNLFGNYDFVNGRDTKGSYYLDLSAPFEVGGGFTLTPHIGYQKVKNLDVASYSDYAVTLSKDFSGFLLSASVVGTDADKTFYASPANGKFLGRSGVVLQAKYSF
ncbi:MAG: TorF family putative porin [Pseudomonadota bacterium]